MIGLSVPLCVRDIVEGRVALGQVDKIVAGTKIPDAESWERCILMHRGTYWRDNPDESEQILRQLLVEGKIHQPLLDPENGSRPDFSADDGPIYWWVNTESEIKWC